MKNKIFHTQICACGPKFAGCEKGMVVKMIDKETFHPLNYIKKEEYSSSMDGMRYLLKKVVKEEETLLEVTFWPEPFGYHATKEEEKTRAYFPLTADGVEQSADYLNEQYLAQKSRWDAAKDWRYKV